MGDEKLTYTLQLFGLPTIRDIRELSGLIHLSPSLLYRLSKFHNEYYKVFSVPKKQGGVRIIMCPSRKMKAVQAWILRNILEKVSVSSHAMGFRKNTNIALNANQHIGNKYFACLDLEDFFPTITYAQVYNVFKTIGYGQFTAHILTAYCTYEGKLPQGAVTSPALSNIVCSRLDKRVAAYAGKLNVSYTRYADDICFSALSPQRLVLMVKALRKILVSEKFTINEKKTRFAGPARRRSVTGLVYDGKGFGIGREQFKLLRAKVHTICVKPLPDQERNDLENHLCGWCNFLNDVDPKRLKQLRHFFNEVHTDASAPLSRLSVLMSGKGKPVK